MSTHTVQLRLQVTGQQAAQQLNQIALRQAQSQQQIQQSHQRLAPLTQQQINRARQTLQQMQQQGTALSQQHRITVANNTARQLGIRTEQQINREIAQTRANYSRLSILQRQGAVSANDMQRAYAAMNTRVAQLNRELGRTAQTQNNIARSTQANTGGASGSGSGILQKGAAIAGGVIAAGAVLQEPIQRTVNYDRDLHYASQKLSSDSKDWESAKQWMNSTVVDNAKKGGVNRDQSFLAMDDLIATGAYNDDDLSKMKANLGKAHFEAAKSALASGGDILDFAKVGTAAKSRGLDESRAQAMVIKADDLGAMSAKDLAKVLPAQLGALPVDRVNGERQFAQLVALNEVAMNTAGNADEAANNVKNLLSKMYSDDTNKRLKKDYRINLPKLYAKGKEKDMTDFDVLNHVVDSILAKDKNAKSLVEKIKAANGDQEKLSVLKTQQAIFEQSGLAAILPDMQSLMALVASNRHGDKWEEMTNVAMMEGAATRDKKYSYNQEKLAAYGFNAFDVTRKDGEFQSLQSTVQKIGEMGTRVAELTDQYPILTKAMGTAELALKTLAAAGFGAAVGGMLGRGGAGGAATAAAGAAGTTAGGAITAVGRSSVGALAGSTVGRLAVGAGVGVAATAGYATGTAIRDKYLTTESGQNFDNAIGGTIATIMSKLPGWMGGDAAREALESEMNYLSGLTEQQVTQQQEQNQKISEQTQLSKDLSNKLSTLISVTQQNKPVFNISGGSLLDQISQHARTEERRHGVDLLSYGQK